MTSAPPTTQNTTTTRGIGGLDLTEPRFLSKLWPTKNPKLILLCSIDVWNLYLHFRQLEFILKNVDVPEVLADVVSQAEYSTIRRQAAFFISLSIFSLGGRLYSHTFSMSDGYAPLIWSYTMSYTRNRNYRAIIYSTLEDFTSKLIVVPIIVLLAIFHQGMKVSPLGMIMAGVVWLVGSAITTSLRTAILVKATNKYGKDFFIYLGFLYELMIIVGHMAFIQLLAPFMMSVVPEGPAKTTIDSVASKAGYYPRHAVYYEPNVEGRPDLDPNAYHAGLLGSSMIVVSESLLKIVGPTDIGAVVAHELGHWHYSHSAYSFTSNVLANICFIMASMWSYGNAEVFEMFSFDFSDPPHPIIGVLLISKYFFPILGGFIMGFRGVMSYFCEFAADGFAVKMGLGTELRRSLVNLVSRIKVFPGVDAWYAAWFRGHPSLVLRIEELAK